MHYFEDLPSPAYLQGRYLLIVSMWKIPGSMWDAIDKLSEKEPQIDKKLEWNCDVRMSYSSKETVAMCSLKFICPIYQPTDSSLSEVEGMLTKQLLLIEQFFIDHLGEAKNITSDFWHTEIGMTFN